MSDPFLGELRAFAHDRIPRGWTRCDGQVLPINQNQALYSLLGTTYGGDGRTTFALPDLRGRVPLAAGPTHPLGQPAGTETVVLSGGQLPGHGHQWMADTTTATTPSPADGLLAASAATSPGWATGTGRVAMASGVVGTTGGSQGHDNMQPWAALVYAIALVGIFPSRT